MFLSSHNFNSTKRAMAVSLHVDSQVHPHFLTNPDSDLIIRSSENVDFHVSMAILSRSSQNRLGDLLRPLIEASTPTRKTSFVSHVIRVLESHKLCQLILHTRTRSVNWTGGHLWCLILILVPWYWTSYGTCGLLLHDFHVIKQLGDY